MDSQRELKFGGDGVQGGGLCREKGEQKELTMSMAKEDLPVGAWLAKGSTPPRRSAQTRKVDQAEWGGRRSGSEGRWWRQPVVGTRKRASQSLERFAPRDGEREQVGGGCKVCGLEARVTRETARVVGCQILSARPYSPVFDSVSDPYLFFSSFFETSKHARARTSIRYKRCVDGFLALVIVLWYFGEKFLN
jgi:hypothetical protein